MRNKPEHCGHFFIIFTHQRRCNKCYEVTSIITLGGMSDTLNRARSPKPSLTVITGQCYVRNIFDFPYYPQNFSTN